LKNINKNKILERLVRFLSKIRCCWTIEMLNNSYNVGCRSLFLHPSTNWDILGPVTHFFDGIEFNIFWADESVRISVGTLAEMTT
jgi:hypothetical protein